MNGDMMTGPELAALRKSMGLSQHDFWGGLGVTQSAGSRYETGRNVPAQVLLLVRLMYREGIDVRSISGQDWAIVEYLRQHDAAQYKRLVKTVRQLRAKC